MTQNEKLTNYSVANILSSYFGQGRSTTFAPLVLDCVPYWNEIVHNRVFYTGTYEVKAETVESAVPSYSAKAEVVDMDNAPKPDVLVKGTTLSRDTMEINNGAYTSQFTEKYDTLNMPRGHVVSEWKPTMHQCFPHVLETPITAPVKGPNWVVEESVVGRMYGNNKDDKQLLANYKLIDWKLITKIIEGTFPKLFKYGNDEFEVLLDNIPKLKTRWNNSRELREFADAEEHAYDEFENFVKTEAQVGKIPAEVIVRQIMNDSDVAVLAASPFTKVLSRYCAENELWYGFGKPIFTNQEHIHNMAKVFPYVSENDFTSYDGTQSTLTQTIEIMVYDHVFCDGQIQHLKDMSLHSQVGKGNNKSSTLGTRHSGEAATSLMNTIVNYVLCMYALMSYYPNLPLKDAKLQVITGGDDSLVYFKDVPMAKKFEEVMALFGLTLKAKALPSTSPVRFLSMVYPNAAAGPHVMPDFERVLSKLVLCSSKYDAIHGCAHKLNGYLTMFPDAYLLSDMLRLYLEKLKPYISDRFIKTINDPASLPYSLRMGAPMLCENQSDSLEGQNMDAVDAVIRITNALATKHVFKLGLENKKGVTLTDNNAKGYQNKAIMKMNQTAIDRHLAFKEDTILSPDAPHVTSKKNLDEFVQFVHVNHKQAAVFEAHPNLITAELIQVMPVQLVLLKDNCYNDNKNITPITQDKITTNATIDLTLANTKPTSMFSLRYLTDILANYTDYNGYNYMCICEGQIMLSCMTGYGKPLNELNPNGLNASPNTHLLKDGTTKKDAEEMIKQVAPRSQRRKDWYKVNKQYNAKANNNQGDPKKTDPLVNGSQTVKIPNDQEKRQQLKDMLDQQGATNCSTTTGKVTRKDESDTEDSSLPPSKGKGATDSEKQWKTVPNKVGKERKEHVSQTKQPKSESAPKSKGGKFTRVGASLKKGKVVLSPPKEAARD